MQQTINKFDPIWLIKCYSQCPHVWGEKGDGEHDSSQFFLSCYLVHCLWPQCWTCNEFIDQLKLWWLLSPSHTHTHIDQTDGDGLVLWLVLMRFASRQLLSTYDIDTNVPKGTEPHNTCLSLVYCWLRIRFRSVRPCLFDYPNVYIGDKVLFRAHFCVDRRSFYYCIVRCIELESRSSLDHTHTHKSWCPLSVTMAFSCILAAHNADSLDSDWFIEICFPSLSIDLLVIYASIDSKLGVFRRLLHFKCMLTTTNDIDWYRIWWWWWWWVVVFVLFLMLFTFHLYCNYLTDSFSQLVKNKKERKTSADEQMHI